MPINDDQEYKVPNWLFYIPENAGKLFLITSIFLVNNFYLFG
jgi:hypothetical protein